METKSNITKFILNTDLLDEDSLPRLRETVERYPYFQTARLLYLINLHKLKHVAFNTEMRRSMVFISDRSQLFRLVEGERYELLNYTDVTNTADSPQPSITNLTADYTSFLESMDDLVVDNGEGEKTVPRLRGADLIDDFLSQSKD